MLLTALESPDPVIPIWNTAMLIWKPLKWPGRYHQSKRGEKERFQLLPMDLGGFIKVLEATFRLAAMGIDAEIVVDLRVYALWTGFFAIGY
jgi:hypothetical protein